MIESLDNDVSGLDDVRPDGMIINAGAVLAVLLGIPAFAIGVFGAVGVISGQKLVAGMLGALWGYAAAAGAYELNRRKFDWHLGTRYKDIHLLAGTLAVAFGLVVSGAVDETMPALALVPALSAVKQASDGQKNHMLTLVHAGVLLTGICVGIWFYRDGTIGGAILARIAMLP